MRDLILNRIFDRLFDDEDPFIPCKSVNYTPGTKEWYSSLSDEELLNEYRNFVLVFEE